MMKTSRRRRRKKKKRRRSRWREMMKVKSMNARLNRLLGLKKKSSYLADVCDRNYSS